MPEYLQCIRVSVQICVCVASVSLLFAVVSVNGCRWTAEFLNMTFQRSPGPLPSTSWSGNNAPSHARRMLSSRERSFIDTKYDTLKSHVAAV